METSQIAISIIALAIIAFILIRKRKVGANKKFNPLPLISFVFILTGLFYGDNRTSGYVLIGIGIAISVLDIILKFRRGNR